MTFICLDGELVEDSYDPSTNQYQIPVTQLVVDLIDAKNGWSVEIARLRGELDTRRHVMIALLDTIEDLAGGPDDYFRPIFKELGIGPEELGKTAGDLIEGGDA